MIECNKCGMKFETRLGHVTHRCSVASACSAVDGGTSGCVAPAEIRSVAAGRHVPMSATVESLWYFNRERNLGLTFHQAFELAEWHELNTASLLEQ